MLKKTLTVAYKTARKIVVAVIGFTLVLVGVALIFLPGPAFIVIPVGLTVLGLEFAWARRWLKSLQERASNAMKQVKSAKK